MAVVPIRFLKPFVYAGGTGPNHFAITVDQSVAQLKGFVEAAVAADLITLGVAATGPTF